jgi:hypothetical protein
MATTINSPLAGEIWHLSIEDLFAPVQETLRLGGDGPFVINLSVSTAPISIPKVPFAGCESAHMYQIQVSEDGRTRYRLRLGPFTTEDEADAVLADVREVYPGALTATAGAMDLRTITSLQEKLDAMQAAAKKPPQKLATQNKPTVDPAPPPLASLARSVQPALPVLPEPPVLPVLLAPEIANIPPAALVPPELSTAWEMRIESVPVAKPAMLVKAQAPVTRPPVISKPVPDVIDLEMPMRTAPAACPIPILLAVEAPAPSVPIALKPAPVLAPPVAIAPKAQATGAVTTNKSAMDVIDFDMPMPSAPPAGSLPIVLEVAAPPAPAKAAVLAEPTVAVLAQPVAPAHKAPVAAMPPVAVEPPVAAKAPVAAEPPTLVLAPPAAPVPKTPVVAKPAAAKPAVFAKPPAIQKLAAAAKSPAAPKASMVLTQSVASKPSFFAPKASKGNAKKPGAALTSLQHVATAIVPAPREVKKLPSPLPDLESTQTVRALTPPELENEDTSRWFVIQLSLSDQAFDPDTVPNLDIFSEYRLYSVAGLDQGRVVHALRLGFFSEEVGAVAVASYLGAYYDKPTIRRVSVAERERFSHQRVEARKDVGASGTHAVIEITSDLIARRKRTSLTPIADASLQPGGPQGASPTR